MSFEGTASCPPEEPKKRSAVWLRVLLLVIIAAGIVVAIVRFDPAALLTQENINRWLGRAGPFSPFLYMAVMALVVVISPLPSLPLDIAAGIFFGPIIGTVYSVIGALAGAIMSFMIARLLGRDVVGKLVGGQINFCPACSDRLLTKIVFISRLIPVVSFDLISYGAGLTKMSVGKFALATGLGMIPLTFVYNYFGAVLIVGRWISITAALIFVALFFLVPRWIQKRNFLSLRKYFYHGESEEPPGQNGAVTNSTADPSQTT